MNKSYKEAKPAEIVAESEEARLIKESLTTSVATRIAIEKQIMEIVGPLDARQLWNLLSEAHFPDIVRSKIYTAAEPWQIAFKLFEVVVSYGYPANVYLLQLAGAENIQSERFDANRVQRAMDWLLDTSESMTELLRAHENSH